MFGADQVGELRELLSARFCAQCAALAAERFLQAPPRPSKTLLAHVGEQVSGEESFKLLDEQRLAFDLVRSRLEEAKRSDAKTAVVVLGGPGTGKSVIATQLVGQLASSGYRVAHATGSRSDEDASLVRSEEELAVGKREVEAGRVRIRKWVETEPVQVEVELKREKASITREPADASMPAGTIGDGVEETEVVLREEQAVVSKETVAKERVSVETDVVSESETVTDEVRKERIEVDGDAVDETR